MFFEPLGAWRHVEVTDQRTAIDYAYQMKYLVDERYPDAIRLPSFMTNLILMSLLLSIKLLNQTKPSVF